MPSLRSGFEDQTMLSIIESKLSFFALQSYAKQQAITVALNCYCLFWAFLMAFRLLPNRFTLLPGPESEREGNCKLLYLHSENKENSESEINEPQSTGLYDTEKNSILFCFTTVVQAIAEPWVAYTTQIYFAFISAKLLL